MHTRLRGTATAMCGRSGSRADAHGRLNVLNRRQGPASNSATEGRFVAASHALVRPPPETRLHSTINSARTLDGSISRKAIALERRRSDCSALKAAARRGGCKGYAGRPQGERAARTSECPCHRVYACTRSAWAYHSHASALPAFAARRASGQPLMMRRAPVAKHAAVGERLDPFGERDAVPASDIDASTRSITGAPLWRQDRCPQHERPPAR